jgi:hypothetical protein
MEEVVVKGGETESVSLSITRPRDDSPLARWGYLIIESAEPFGIVGTEGVGVGVKLRFAVSILQREPTIVEKEGHVRAMEVKLIKSGEESSRTALVSSAFVNTCKNILGIDVLFQVRDERGKTIATHEIRNQWVLPEHKRSFIVKFPAEEWLPGQYIALAIIDYGGETLTGGQWGFEIPEEE